MNLQAFCRALDDRIARFDLLGHPFYHAWIQGKLSKIDICNYAADYFPHIAAFPTYLSALHSRLEDGPLRRAVLRTLADEEVEGRAHSDMWLEFAEGMGMPASQVRHRRPVAAVLRLVERFRETARQASIAEVLATFYAHQSQVPRLSCEKARSLLRFYGADPFTCGYFALHTYSDVQQSKLWRDSLICLIEEKPAHADAALDAAERAAEWAWQAVDAIEARRQRKMVAVA